MKLTIFCTSCQTKELLFLILICQKVFNQRRVPSFIKLSLSTEVIIWIFHFDPIRGNNVLHISVDCFLVFWLIANIDFFFNHYVLWRLSKVSSTSYRRFKTSYRHLPSLRVFRLLFLFSSFSAFISLWKLNFFIIFSCQGELMICLWWLILSTWQDLESPKRQTSRRSCKELSRLV